LHRGIAVPNADRQNGKNQERGNACHAQGQGQTAERGGRKPPLKKARVDNEEGQLKTDVEQTPIICTRARGRRGYKTVLSPAIARKGKKTKISKMSLTCTRIRQQLPKRCSLLLGERPAVSKKTDWGGSGKDEVELIAQGGTTNFKGLIGLPKDKVRDLQKPCSQERDDLGKGRVKNVAKSGQQDGGIGIKDMNGTPLGQKRTIRQARGGNLPKRHSTPRPRIKGLRRPVETSLRGPREEYIDSGSSNEVMRGPSVTTVT